jgi:hypothetical protein
MALDGLGLVAQCRGQREEARDGFAEACTVFREIGDPLKLAWVLNHQGHNMLALGATKAARESFRTALCLAHECGSRPNSLDALIGLATLYAEDGAGDEAFELVSIVLEHPSSTQAARNAACQVSTRLERRMSPEQIEAARQRARSKDLAEVAQQVLVRLESH